MKILVAGGAGFIGSHLCASLLQNGNEVICIDNLITGDLLNIKDLKNDSKFHFYKWDIVSPLNIKDKIDQIYNLASPASPVDYQNYPLETLLVNSTGCLNLLKLALNNKSRFLFASTSEIYGDPKVHPQVESYWGNVNSYGPRSCYDEAKRFAESLMYTFINKYGVDGRIVRIFNTYGPKMQKDDGRIISNFICQAIENKPLTVYGDGTQTRSFCYVSDMVDGLSLLMGKEGIKGEVINLGNPEEHSVAEIAKIIKKMTSSKSDIINLPLPIDDPVKRCPDIKKAQTTLSFHPEVSLKDGLQRTIDYFRSKISS